MDYETFTRRLYDSVRIARTNAFKHNDIMSLDITVRAFRDGLRTIVKVANEHYGYKSTAATSISELLVYIHDEKLPILVFGELDDWTGEFDRFLATCEPMSTDLTAMEMCDTVKAFLLANGLCAKPGTDLSFEERMNRTFSRVADYTEDPYTLDELCVLIRLFGAHTFTWTRDNVLLSNIMDGFPEESLKGDDIIRISGNCSDIGLGYKASIKKQSDNKFIVTVEV